jgi:hypothetical protein
VEEFEHVDINNDQVSSPGELTDELEPELFLYQAGYLTPRLYPDTTNEYYLTYPNNEVRAGMLNMV